jgi:hypothetical protein
LDNAFLQADIQDDQLHQASGVHESADRKRVRLLSPLRRAANQQATPFPVMAANSTTIPIKSSWGLFTVSSRVFRPENVKNIGSRNTTATGSSCRFQLNRIARRLETG